MIFVQEWHDSMLLVGLTGDICVCVCVCLLLLKLGDKAAPRSELNLPNPSFRDLWGPEISKKINIFLIILIKSA